MKQLQRPDRPITRVDGLLESGAAELLGFEVDMPAPTCVLCSLLLKTNIASGQKCCGPNSTMVVIGKN